MSRISENIRKITKAWGGKTTGNGISDAIMDLANNLPFSKETVTEWVEIVAERTLTTSTKLDNSYYVKVIDEKNTGFLTAGQKLKVTLNGVEHETVAYSSTVIGNAYLINSNNENTGEDFAFMKMSTQLSFYTKEPMTATVRIEKETEKVVYHPIDPNFLALEVVNLTVTTAGGETKTYELYGREITNET